jgi:TonB-dependent receptor
LLLVALASAPLRAQGQVGAIRGSVVESDFDVPLGEVRVSVIGSSLSTLTTETGAFVIQGVSPGEYTLSFSKPGFDREIKADVIVTPGQVTDVGSVYLRQEVFEMDEMVVTGADLLADTELGLLELRAESLTVQDSISSELISQSGAGDVAGALKLVTGASVVEGKYATVRGLSDRYTGTTLNGVRVPSPDPRKRAVQIDLFPTGTIESITVTKTFTPDLQGDFTGGGINVVTRSVPDQYFLNVSLGAEYNSIATGNERFLTYLGGGVPASGIAGSGRELPDGARNPTFARDYFTINFSDNPSALDQQASNDYDEFTNSFEPVMGSSSSAPDVNTGFSVSSGSVFNVGGDDVLGVTGALTYRRKNDLALDGENNRGGVGTPTGPIILGVQREDNVGTETVLWGALLTTVWQPNPNHDLTFRAIANQGADDVARLQVRDIQQNQSLRYTERSLRSFQLHGSHRLDAIGGMTFSGPSIDWFAAYNTTYQDEPDVRFFFNSVTVQDLNGDGELDQVTYGEPADTTPRDRTRRIFRNIEEDNIQGSVNLSIPFANWNSVSGLIKVGGYAESGERTFEQLGYFYRFPANSRFERGSGDERFATVCNQRKLRYASPNLDGLWTDAFLSPDRVGLSPDEVFCDTGEGPFPNPAPNQLLWTLVPDEEGNVEYLAQQDINALYAMAEIPFGPKISLTAGARYESTGISIEPEGSISIVVQTESGARTTRAASPEEGRAEIDQGQLLPALALQYRITPTMTFRAAVSQTIARPTYRELAPVVNEEFLQGDEYLGNNELVLSTVDNYDLRWEWFRRPGDVLAASVFYKQIADPIEQISFTLSTGSQRSIVTPVNFERGELQGVEFEFRSGLDEIWRGFRGLAFGANFTLLDSSVEVPLTEQGALAGAGLEQEERPLQGQPDSVLNLNLTYNNPRTATTVGAFYNRIGETLFTGAAVGFDGTPNVFVEPYAILDLTLRQQLARVGRGGRYALFLSLRAKNMLAQDRTELYVLPRPRIENGMQQPETAVKSQYETPRIYAVSMGIRF